MTKHILVIDDDDDFRDYLKKLLTKQGYFVKTASCGSEALNEINGVIPDLIITDIIMPDMDGHELIRKIKGQFPDIKIMAMSGGGIIKPKLYLEMALKLRADGIFEKPIKKDELLEKIILILSEV